MDMTKLTYPDESFDVVLDKGALDALMSNDSVECRAQASDMFSCIARVLRNGGRYICITLAERFILEHLMGYFLGNMSEGIEGSSGAGSGTGLGFAFHTLMEVCPPSASSPSPFLPFAVIITKNPQHALQAPSPLVTCMFDSFGTPVKSRQQAKIVSLGDLVPLVRGAAVWWGVFECHYLYVFWVCAVSLMSVAFRYRTYSLSRRNVSTCLLCALGNDSRCACPRRTVLCISLDSCCVHAKVVDIHSTEVESPIPRFSIIVFDFASRAARCDIAMRTLAPRVLM